MGSLMDLIMVAFVLTVIIVNTKRGCKTLLNLMVTVCAFAAAYFFGPDVGEYFTLDVITENIESVIHDVLVSVVGDTAESVTVSDLFSEIPESFESLLERTGANVDKLVESIGEMTIVSEETLGDIARRLAEPVGEWLAVALGCVTVFVAALIVLHIVKWLIQLIIKLPVLKQANYVLGFLVGIISAFIWSWVICTAVSLIIEYSLLGEYNATLARIAETSYFFGFFRDFALVDLLNF